MDSPRLTIGKMALPVLPFVVVLILQSLVFFDSSTDVENRSWTEIRYCPDGSVVNESKSRDVVVVNLTWRFGPCVVSSTTQTLKSLFIETSSNTLGELNEKLNVSLDRSRSWVAVCVFPIAVIASIVIGRFLQWHSRVTIPGSLPYPPLRTVGACMGVLFTFVVGFAIMKSWWPPGVSELVRYFHVRAGVTVFIGMVIVAPVAEELIFRSFLCRFLVERIGPVAGIVLQALVFGGLHFATPLHMVVAFAGGIVLGTVYVYTRSLAATIFLHAGANALLLGACVAFG